MDQFEGFTSNPKHAIEIPTQFLSEVLPKIENLYELKIILYAFWNHEQSELDFPFLSQSVLLDNEIISSGFGHTREEQIENVLQGLKLAVADKILLAAKIALENQQHTLYFINSERGKKAAEAIQSGAFTFNPNDLHSFRIEVTPKNVFTLYEENIGPLTPIIAESLKELENNYSSEWIEEAFQEALKNNVRKLRYIEAILVNWQEAGRYDRTDRRRGKKSEEEYDPDRYIDGEYSEFIDH